MNHPSRKAQVSVLVPVYNTQAYLEQCLDALISQTLHDIEIIVIDDGSTDESGSIIDRYSQKDERICVIHKKNSGYGDSMNTGLETASAPWVVFVEPDDYPEPTMCEHLLKVAHSFCAAGMSVDVVKGSYLRVITLSNGSIERIPTWTYHSPELPSRPFTIDECPLFLTGHPSIWTALYRRGFLDELGIRFLPIPGAGWADNPFFLETMIAARSIVYTDEIVYNYREFEDGTLSHLADWRIITDRWREMGEVLEKYDVRSPIIIESHDFRGCSYLQMLHDDFAQDEKLVDAARAMASTIDFDIVRRSSLIPKELKFAYARYLPASRRVSLLASWLALQAKSVGTRARNRMSSLQAGH